MPSTIDLNLLPLSRQNGQDDSNLPGLYMVTPPRKPARGRDSDQLILFFTMTGNAPLSADQQEQILGRLAQTYYKTPGAVTTSLRATAEAMNQFLLDRNLRSSSSGHQCIGQLALAVLREQRLILGQCGPTYAFLLTGQGAQHLFDPQGAGRGLGYTRSISIRYYQVDLNPGDLLILTQQLPPIWTAILEQRMDNQGIESLRRRLLSQAGSDVNAVIIQAQNGTGKLLRLRPKAPVQMAQEPSEAGATTTRPGPAPQEQAAPEIVAPASPELDISQPLISSQPPIKGQPVTPLEAAPASPVQISGSAAAEPAAENVAVTKKPERKPRSAPQVISAPQGISAPRISVAPAARAILKLWGAFGGAFGSVTYGLKSILWRLLPDESLFSIPTSTMAFIAIAMALVVATTGGAVYFQRGREAQYQSYYNQAVKAAETASPQTDPVELRTGWETVIDYLDRADIYITPPSPGSQTLRAQAISAIDNLDTIVRLNYQPVLSLPLGASIQVTRMVATDHDLFLLNGTNGNVLRAILTGQGYEIDPNFVCGPNPTVSPIVDIVPMPKGNDQKAAILAMDGNANFMYCLTDALPVANIPAPPQSNWVKPQAFAFDTGDLYVLDPQTNGVWIYRNENLTKQPHLFFGEQVPPMKDTIDLAVNQDDLYLLHADGHLTTCTYSSLQESPTRCEDPATFTDLRKGRQNGPLILDAQFSQILFSPPPDPSIYLFDPVHQSIYHFSVKLALQVQYRARQSLPSSNGTAFTVGPNRSIFLAVGNQVYYASLP